MFFDGYECYCLFFYHPVFTLLTFSLSLTSQSSNIIPILSLISLPVVSPSPSSFLVQSEGRMVSAAKRVCVCVCVSWVQGEKRSRVQSSVIMECFNSLRCLYATSLSLSLSFFPSPTIPPLPDVFTVECPPFSQAREVSVVPAIYLVLSLS